MTIDAPDLVRRLGSQAARARSLGLAAAPLEPERVEPDPAALARFRAHQPPPRADGTLPVRVGCIADRIDVAGGAPHWLEVPIRRFDPARVWIVGLAVLDPAGATGPAADRLRSLVPTATGPGAAAALARCVDVLLLWEVSSSVEPYLPGTGAVPAVVHVTGAPETGLIVPPQRGRGPVRAEWGIGPDARVLGYLGPVGPAERLDLLIDVLAVLPAAENWHLVVAGDGPSGRLASLRAQAARQGLGPRVHLIGPRSDVGDVLAGIDVLVRPSESETASLGLAQAMEAGIPVIATPGGWIADRTDLARIVPAEAGAADWAAAVRADLTDQQGTRARVDAARRAVAGAFPAEGRVRAWQDVLVEQGEAARAAPPRQVPPVAPAVRPPREQQTTVQAVAGPDTAVPVRSVPPAVVTHETRLMAVVGPRLWADLHKRPLAFRGDAVAERAWLDLFTLRLPCGSCRASWRALVAEMPPDLADAARYARWGWACHNEVNKKLDKPVIGWAEAAWQWGWPRDWGPPES
jgi:glycosyltransferase involved in cell wall biosynthesis